MFFSIIIPTYNRAHLIVATIETILNQTFTNYEIIVVDDGSIDATSTIINTLNNIKINYIKTENKGVAHARNTGIKAAKGQYIGFLDSDDIMETYHLQTAYNSIQQYKQPLIIHFNFLFGTADKLNCTKNRLPKTLPNDIFNSCSLHVNCVFIHHSIAQQNLFNESRALMFAEDWDFFIKLVTRYPIQLVDTTTTYLVDHNDRSMRSFNEQQWVIRRNAIVQSLNEDSIVKQKHASEINIVHAHMNSLIALNFAVRSYKLKTIRYWLQSIGQNPSEIATRRTLAILKHVLLTW